MNNILVINGGTTNLRISLLKDGKTEADTWQCDAGVRHTAIDGNNEYLRNNVRLGIVELMERYQLQAGDIDCCVAYGMITSNLGLYELPHIIAPAGPDDFRNAMAEVSFPELVPFPIHFIPGLRNNNDPVTLENVADTDMMRGEETEAVGLHALLGTHEDLILTLPGSHNKFIAMDSQGRLMGCMTSISGELLDALTHHTILSGSVNDGFVTPDTYDREYFLAGAAAAEKGIGRAAFTTRLMQTLGHINTDQARSFLLGVALSDDYEALRNFSLFHGQRIIIAGKAPVTTALVDLFTNHDLQAESLPEDITAKMGTAGACLIAGI